MSTPFDPQPCAAGGGGGDAGNDVELEVLCDSEGTQFLRRYVYTPLGALSGTVDTTLDGTTPFVPVGAVSQCVGEVTVQEPLEVTVTGPVTVAEPVTVDGAVTVTGGPVSVTGTVTATLSTPTVLAQHFEVLPGSPWTPALVTGVATSVSYTVITGTATVADSNGTSITLIPSGYSATWNNGVEGTLTPPTSIASVGGRIIVHWTEK